MDPPPPTTTTNLSELHIQVLSAAATTEVDVSGDFGENFVEFAVHKAGDGLRHGGVDGLANGATEQIHHEVVQPRVPMAREVQLHFVEVDVTVDDRHVRPAVHNTERHTDIDVALLRHSRQVAVIAHVRPVHFAPVPREFDGQPCAGHPKAELIGRSERERGGRNVETMKGGNRVQTDRCQQKGWKGVGGKRRTRGLLRHHNLREVKCDVTNHRQIRLQRTGTHKRRKPDTLSGREGGRREEAVRPTSRWMSGSAKFWN
jgi:hypothetical protein